MSNLSLFISVSEVIVLILIASQLFGKLMVMLGQPKVVGEMLAGIILGPTCFGYFFPSCSAQVFSPVVMPYLYVIGNIGLSVYMFTIGAELNVSLFNRKAVKQASIVSVSTVVIPSPKLWLIIPSAI